MARKYFVLSFLFLFVTIPAVSAEEPGNEGIEREVRSLLEGDEITLVDLFRLADLTSPSLAAARSGVEAGAGRVRQVQLYPNPTLEFEIGDASTDDLGQREEKAALVQPLVFGGRRGAAAEAAGAELEAVTEVLRGTRADIRRRIHELWAQQLYFRESGAALAELLEVTRHTHDVARARFDARAVPESQVTRALLEVYELDVQRQELVQGQAAAEARLAALFGGLRIPVDRLAGSLIADDTPLRESLLVGDLDEHPALRAARLDVIVAEALLREARAARIPDLDLVVAWGRSRSTDETFVEAGLAIPLPVFDRKQGRVAETRAGIAQARHLARVVQSDLDAHLEITRRQYLTVHEQLDAVRDRILPAAERAMGQAREGYRVGRLPFLDVIDAQRIYADNRLRTLELARDLAVVEAELMSLLGTGPYGNEGVLP